MEEMTVKQADNFDLVISEMTVGTLISNAMEVRNSVFEFLKNCDVASYKGNAKDAANDKAKFNALAKKLNDERIRLEKKFLEPFIPFKEIVAETTKAIEKVSAGLDKIVKAKDAEEKEAKRAEIVEIWKVYNFALVPLERIFNDKWLNKGYKIKQIHDDIAHIIDQITGDLQSIEQFGEDIDTLKELYLTTLDLQSTLRRGAELRENRRRLAEEAERKARLEAERQAAEEARKAEFENLKPAITTQTTKADLERAGYVETTRPVTTEDSEPVPNNATTANSVPVYKTGFAKTEQPTEKTFNFYLLDPIIELAKDSGISVEPVFITATLQQIKDFKAAMEAKGYIYNKATYNGQLLLDVSLK